MHVHYMSNRATHINTNTWHETCEFHNSTNVLAYHSPVQSLPVEFPQIQRNIWRITVNFVYFKTNWDFAPNSEP